MMDQEHLILELHRIASECRLQSKSLKPQIALLRAAAAISSLASSFTVDPSSHSPLSKREAEILFHVSQGFTNREIASAFNLSEKTIEFHLKSIFSKTGASSRTEAVKNAMVEKWI